jgi:V/A-type H+-transporting ATPase subunit A
MQQDSFNPVDSSVSPERQNHTFLVILQILGTKLAFTEKAEARTWFNHLRQKFLDYNGTSWKDKEFMVLEKDLINAVAERSQGLDKTVEKLLA